MKAIRNLVSRATKMIACAAIAAAVLAFLPGMANPVCNAAPLQEGADEEADAVVIADLSMIEDGYDANESGVAYLIAIPEF